MGATGNQLTLQAAKLALFIALEIGLQLLKSQPAHETAACLILQHSYIDAHFW